MFGDGGRQDALSVLFIGARQVGYLCLARLLAAGVDICGLLVLDPQKKRITTAYRAFDDLIERYDLNYQTFKTLRSAATASFISACRPQLGIVVGVSQLVGPELLSLPSLGFMGMHPTLLPIGGGRAPIPWAIIKGLTCTGVTIFKLDEGADTGAIAAQRPVPIFYDDTSRTLGARTDTVAAELLIEVVSKASQGRLLCRPQDVGRQTVWPRRRPSDGIIDWSRNRRQLYDWIRALTHPYPGAFTFLGDQQIWVWQGCESKIVRRGAPGQILARRTDGVVVATGEGNIRLIQMSIDSAGRHLWQPDETVVNRHFSNGSLNAQPSNPKAKVEAVL